MMYGLYMCRKVGPGLLRGTYVSPMWFLLLLHLDKPARHYPNVKVYCHMQLVATDRGAGTGTMRSSPL
eukprot:35628-Eustigmatos_ZCMA.PRE.1